MFTFSTSLTRLEFINKMLRQTIKIQKTGNSVYPRLWMVAKNWIWKTLEKSNKEINYTRLGLGILNFKTEMN